MEKVDFQISTRLSNFVKTRNPRYSVGRDRRIPPKCDADVDVSAGIGVPALQYKRRDLRDRKFSHSLVGEWTNHEPLARARGYGSPANLDPWFLGFSK